jgi:hypothetical protein
MDEPQQFATIPPGTRFRLLGWPDLPVLHKPAKNEVLRRLYANAYALKDDGQRIHYFVKEDEPCKPSH